jgi:hypothetical protein
LGIFFSLPCYVVLRCLNEANYLGKHCSKAPIRLPVDHDVGRAPEKSPAISNPVIWTKNYSQRSLGNQNNNTRNRRDFLGAPFAFE